MDLASVDSSALVASAKTAVRKIGQRRVLVLCARFLVSASLIVYLVSKADLLTIWESVRSADRVLIVTSFVLHGIGYFSSGYRWRILLRAQGADISVAYLVRSYAAAMFFNNVLPSTIGGDAYRAYDTARRGVPRLRSLAVVIVERLLGLFALVVFAVMALALAAELTAQIRGLWLWSLLALFFMSGLVWFIFLSSDKSVWIDKMPSNPGIGLVKRQLVKIKESLAPFRGQTKALAWAMLLSLVLQLNVIFHYYLISEALDLSIGFVKFLVIIPLATFVQMVPVSINGIGIRESFYVFFLSTVYGVPLTVALAFSWIAYGMVLVLGVLGGIIYALRR